MADYQSVQITKLAILNGTTNELYCTWNWPRITYSYYKKCSSSVKTFSSGLTAVGVKANLTNKTKIAKLNGYSKYSKSTQKTYDPDLLTLLKNGKLIKSSSTATVQHTDNYSVQWQYLQNDVWFSGSDETSDLKNSQYTIPDNATQVRVRVKAVAEEHDVTDSSGSTTSVPYWTSSWSAWEKYLVKNERPEVPSDITAEFIDATTESESAQNKKNYTIKCTATAGSDAHTTHIQFQIETYNGTGNVSGDSQLVKVKTESAIYTFTNVGAGTKYVVRARAYNSSAKLYSNWSNWSTDPVSTPPDATKLKPKASSYSSTSIYVTWKALGSSKVDSYKIYYGKLADPKYTEPESWEEKPISDPDQNSDTIEGLETASYYMIKMSALNTINGTETESNTVMADGCPVILGLTPDPPTTWASTTTLKTSQDLILYWIHNSKDGSEEQTATVKLSVSTDGGETYTDTEYEVPNSHWHQPGDYTESIYSYTIPGGTYSSDTIIKWCVKTAGIIDSEQEIPIGYSDYSIVRRVDVYSEPVINVSIKQGNLIEPLSDQGTIEMLPLEFTVTHTPSTQTVTSYYLEIYANEAYSLLDETGDDVSVSVGERVFNNWYDASDDPYIITVSAGTVILANNISYTFKIRASFDSGLSAEYSIEATTGFEPSSFNPMAYIDAISTDDYSIVVHPYCQSLDLDYDEIPVYRFESLNENGSIFIDDETNPDAEPIDDDGNYNNCSEITVKAGTSATFELAMTDTDYIKSFIGHRRLAVACDLEEPDSDHYMHGTYDFKFPNGDQRVVPIFNLGIRIYDGLEILLPNYDEYFEKASRVKIDMYISNKSDTEFSTEFLLSFMNEGPTEEIEQYTDDVTLSLYRREFDGTLTEIARGLDNTAATYCTDPHPALDYARYRVVATETDTGRITYSDITPQYIGVKSIVINWNESWSNYDESSGEAISEVAESLSNGSTLVLPYNIDVSENNSLDVSLVEYIGRKHPVSYYGTQVGQKASWSCEIPATDTETLYQLRRLSVWQGDVYVREPSGVGYWAQISVSMSQTHCELTIPVSIEITRVDGGM